MYFVLYYCALILQILFVEAAGIEPARAYARFNMATLTSAAVPYFASVCPPQFPSTVRSGLPRAGLAGVSLIMRVIQTL